MLNTKSKKLNNIINKINRRKNFKNFKEYEKFLHKTKKYIYKNKLHIHPFNIQHEQLSKYRPIRYIINWLLKTYYITKPEIISSKRQIYTQKKLLFKFIKKSEKTDFWKKYNFSEIQTIDDFKKLVPIHHYKDLKPRIIKCLKWWKNIIYPGKIPRFATSSWTTSTEEKYIPITYDNLRYSHYKWSQTLMWFYYKHNPLAKLFQWKTLIIGWSFCKNPYTNQNNVWFITAILQKNAPKFIKYFKEPKPEISYIQNREEKINKTIKTSIKQNITGISWSPVRCANFLTEILKYTKKGNIQEIRPNIELIIRGWMPIDLYKNLFKKIIQNKNTKYYQAYNASEGFFGVQIANNDKDMLLLTNHWTFYEFITLQEYHNNNNNKYNTITLSGVKIEQEYVIVLTNNSWLRRYIIGDTIKFTSINPFKIKVTWRTKYFIDLAGERMTQDTAEIAFIETCKYFWKDPQEYTIWPNKQNNKYWHHRIIETKNQPNSKKEKQQKEEKEFAKKLDEILLKNDSYYYEERIITNTLQAPIVTFVPPKTFYKRLKSKNKLWGQSKIPKLSNSNKYIKEILHCIYKTNY